MMKVTVQLPEAVYERAQQFAQRRQQDMEEAISALVEQGLAADEAEDAAENEVVDWTAPDPAVARERQAYRLLHPQLKAQYLGRYVAIFQGQLIDHDSDPAALATRVKAKHPDKFVFITQVRQEPVRTIVVRSPRIVRE